MSMTDLKAEDLLDYVVGGLTADKRAAIDEARTKDSHLDGALFEHEISLAPLFLAGPPIDAPSEIWAALDAQISITSSHLDQLDIDLMEQGVWAITGEGVRTKMLWDGRSLLIECQAGACIPEHEHWAEERILVLSGDVCFGDRSYGQGDAISMKLGTHHGITTTKTGCLFLLSYVN
jgi:anti-sigma factor ChrR (cupin superfamily)